MGAPGCVGDGPGPGCTGLPGWPGWCGPAGGVGIAGIVPPPGGTGDPGCTGIIGAPGWAVSLAAKAADPPHTPTAIARHIKIGFMFTSRKEPSNRGTIPPSG